MLYCSSPSDTSMIQPWTPPPIQGFSTDELETSTKRYPVSGPLSFPPTMEGTSIMRDGGRSPSSRSEGSDFEHTTKLLLSTHCSFPSHRSFLSKPIHSLYFALQTSTRESSEVYSEYERTPPQRDAHHMSSSSSSMDLTDISEQFESDNLGQAYNNRTNGFKCGLCDRFLAQRSPWSSRRIVRNVDMPVTGVLSCRHVFHAECLEQATPKARKSDPPCPLCSKLELRNCFPGPKASTEDAGPSRPWGCSQAGDCVEGAIRGPHRSSMLLLSRNRIKKNLSLKSNTSKESPGKPRKIGCSLPNMKR